MIFDRKWFNKLYYKWTDAVYEKNPELAKELDKVVVGGLGKTMAFAIKEKNPKDQYSMDDLINALQESHWFQEKVEIVEKSDNQIILQTRDCSWQLAWLKKYRDIYSCVNSHNAFLEAFCKEIDHRLRVENLLVPSKNPEDGIYCKWKIYKL